MRAFVVYWHPEPPSFNAAMFRTALESLSAAGHEVAASDLWAMGFEAASSRTNSTSLRDAGFFKPEAEEMLASETGGFATEIEAELRKLEACDLMILQFPLWWFGLPAVLKGWVDRVFAMGRIYGGGRLYEKGILRGKRAMLSLTTGGPQATYTRGGMHGDLMGILRPIHRGILQFVGFDVLAPHVVYGPARMTAEEREAQFASFSERLKAIDQEEPIEVGEY